MQTPEELMLRILNKLSDKMKNKIVLKGGMLLRLYNSPRATQDIDFILVSTESKKILKVEIVAALEEIDGIVLEDIRLNSRGIFIDIWDSINQERCLIEISVTPSMYLPPEPISTAPLAQKNKLEARIVTAMSFKEAFAHKIAASLEREVMRDLYDLSQMQAMGSFDLNTLMERLKKLTIKRAKPKNISLKEAAEILQMKSKNLTQEKIEEELYPLLPSQYQAGVLMVIKNSMNQIIQILNNTPD